MYAFIASEGTTLFFFRNNGADPGRRFRLAYGATIAIASVLCVIVVGHDLFRTWMDRSHQIESTQREATNMAWTADQDAENVFRLVGTTLINVVDRVEADGTGIAQMERLRRVMGQQQAIAPVLLTWAVIDEKGALIADATSTTPQIDLTDRAYFNTIWRTPIANRLSARSTTPRSLVNR